MTYTLQYQDVGLFAYLQPIASLEERSSEERVQRVKKKKKALERFKEIGWRNTREEILERARAEVSQSPESLGVYREYTEHLAHFLHKAFAETGDSVDTKRKVSFFNLFKKLDESMLDLL